MKTRDSTYRKRAEKIRQFFSDVKVKKNYSASEKRVITKRWNLFSRVITSGNFRFVAANRYKREKLRRNDAVLHTTNKGVFIRIPKTATESKRKNLEVKIDYRSSTIEFRSKGYREIIIPLDRKKLAKDTPGELSQKLARQVIREKRAKRRIVRPTAFSIRYGDGYIARSTDSLISLAKYIRDLVDEIESQREVMSRQKRVHNITSLRLIYIAKEIRERAKREKEDEFGEEYGWALLPSYEEIEMRELWDDISRNPKKYA